MIPKITSTFIATNLAQTPANWTKDCYGASETSNYWADSCSFDYWSYSPMSYWFAYECAVTAFLAVQEPVAP